MSYKYNPETIKKQYDTKYNNGAGEIPFNTLGIGHDQWSLDDYSAYNPDLPMYVHFDMVHRFRDNDYYGVRFNKYCKIYNIDFLYWNSPVWSISDIYFRNTFDFSYVTTILKLTNRTVTENGTDLIITIPNHGIPVYQGIFNVAFDTQYIGDESESRNTERAQIVDENNIKILDMNTVTFNSHVYDDNQYKLLCQPVITTGFAGQDMSNYAVRMLMDFSFTTGYPDDYQWKEYITCDE